MSYVTSKLALATLEPLGLLLSPTEVRIGLWSLENTAISFGSLARIADFLLSLNEVAELYIGLLFLFKGLVELVLRRISAHYVRVYLGSDLVVWG